ncbi:sodium/potassium-transporting ATPase subunit beta-2-like [Prorops nasuta]|uniref:sodium/potassium-transporting ATPase subunit beta-2-like n=1 Tax=Prorops nasuta TaxID=863751 RepID=UPI0034CDF400
MSVPGKRVQNGTYDFDDYMRVADTRTRWKVICDGIYNPAKGTYLDKTPKQWGVTGLFYLIFFSVLAVFFAICMKGLMASLPTERPRWTLDSSLIGTTPGLGFRPISENTAERSLIWYSASNATQVEIWANRLDKFLEQYKNSSLLPNGGRNQQICSSAQPLKEGNACAVDVNNWGPCSPEERYGYNNSSPCIFIKLNRIFDWVPDYYNDPQNLHKDMPEELVNYIKNTNSSWLNTVWVSCKGENPHDKEAIGELEYYPKYHGFPGYYYPYRNTPGYLSPVVAVRFLRPARNRIINVECRAWAKNVQYSSVKSEKKGATHFELMVDD